MAITTLNEIWEIINSELARDEWISLQNIYSLIEANIRLKDDDFLPSAPNISEPKWMRNVRNVLQNRKGTGDIAWDRICGGPKQSQANDCNQAKERIY